MPHVDEGQVHAYLDGECTAAERLALELHIRDCDPCTAILEEGATTKSLAAQLIGELAPDVEAPAWQALLGRADEDLDEGREEGREESPEEGRADGTVPLPRPQGTRRRQLAWAATLVLAFTLGWQASRGFGPDTSGFTGELRPGEPVGGQAGDQRDDEPVASSSPAAPAGARPAPPTSLAPKADTAPASEAEAVRVLEAKAAPGPATDELVGDERAARVATAPPSRSVVAPLAAQTANGLRRPARAEEAATREALVAAAVTDVEEDRLELSVRPEAPQGVAAAASNVRTPTEIDTAASFREFRVTGEMAAVDALAAADWLGAAPLRLEDATEMEVSVGPGGGLPDATRGRPLLRYLYVLADGAEVTLLQQRVEAADAELADLDAEQPAAQRRQLAAAPRQAGRAGSRLETAVFSVHPNGERMLRWRDPRGYLVWLRGLVDEADLRRLAGELRR